MFNHLPHKETAMCVVFRQLASVFNTVRFRELWVEAQHDSQGGDVLSLLNAQAHAYACARVPCVVPGTVQLGEYLSGRLALFFHGQLILCPSSVVIELDERGVRTSGTLRAYRLTYNGTPVFCGG